MSAAVHLGNEPCMMAFQDLGVVLEMLRRNERCKIMTYWLFLEHDMILNRTINWIRSRCSKKSLYHL